MRKNVWNNSLIMNKENRKEALMYDILSIIATVESFPS